MDAGWTDASGVGATADAAAGEGGPGEDAGCLRLDADSDGFVATRCGGDDCDDADPTVHPGACEVGPAWSVESIGVLAHGDDPSIAIDASGGVHTMFRGDDGVSVATNASGVWESELVDPDGRSGIGIAFESGGAMVLAYVREDGLAYARNEGLGWSVELVGEANVARDAYLALDASDAPHIVYVGNHEVRSATKEDGDWAVRSILVAVGFSGGVESIVVDDDDAAHVLVSWNFLQYATDAGTATWETEILGEGAIAGSLALDSDGALYSAYVAPNLSGGDDVLLARLEGGAWRADSTVGDAFERRPAVAVDETGMVHLTYGRIRSERGEIWHARAPRGEGEHRVWCAEAIASGGGASVLAVDPAGGLHVIFAGVDEGSRLYGESPPGPLLDGIDQDCDGEDGT